MPETLHVWDIVVETVRDVASDCKRTSFYSAPQCVARIASAVAY